MCLIERYVFAVALVFSSSSAFAITCSETVKSVIVHQNGNVYFTTDKTCPNWCGLVWTSADSVSRAYALMLSTSAVPRKLVFAWTTISSCSEVNELYAVPSWVVDQNF